METWKLGNLHQANLSIFEGRKGKARKTELSYCTLVTFTFFCKFFDTVSPSNFIIFRLFVCSALISDFHINYHLDELTEVLPHQVMDLSGVLLFVFEFLARDPNTPYEKRNDAAYIAAVFRVHGDTPRFLAHIKTYLSGNRVIQIRPEIQEVVQNKAFIWCGKTVVQRYENYLQALMTESNIVPTIADYEAHSIRISSILEQYIDDSLDSDAKARIQQQLMRSNHLANCHLIQLAERFGYHPIFRIGVLQLHLT